MRDIKTQVCDRADDLIAFLYHELSERDARNFEQHLHQCAGCERELASFGEIRESIISWRDASLGPDWSLSSVSENHLVRPEAQSRPSAWAALREFFNLSPLWMKGAAAFASLLCCVCAVLAIAYVKGRTSNVVSLPDNKIYSQEELDKEVARAEQVKEEQLRAQLQQQSVVTVVGTQRKPANRPVQTREASYAVNTKPLTRRERRELAADLGLLTSRDEDELDLVTDKITQTP